jgi:hypothetical protein
VPAFKRGGAGLTGTGASPTARAPGPSPADLALHDGTDVDLTPFALDRPALTSPQAEARHLV